MHGAVTDGGEYLSEGVSPSHGMDIKGPTISLKSMARTHCIARVGCGPQFINMKMALMNEAGEEGTQRFMKLIRNWSVLNYGTFNSIF
ncbi:MAG: hypothetical protein IPG78_07360 [Ignavibacteria bacterium]|nr:hypothetical protein [Ignavibacteria bacterium]